MSRRGFSLAEALIAMAIGSLLLMGACRFLPTLQRHILRQGEQLALENELWQRVHAVGKHLQRAGYCRGSCGGAGLELAAGGECLIVRWDANSNGRWETSPAAAAESTGFRLRDGALETLRGASDCRGGGWEKITNPAAIVVTRFSVQRQVTPGFAPELSVTLAARSAQQTGLTSEVEQRVTGYNL
ncbi:prepilin peptidase-dependent protein [Klebsiella pneumoniae]|uniref:prepilin peptidase-dependent protein n=1 Tax=Klebsiella pneumoniae TaxID=573 RepID=UPI000666BB28|nr:prepilin peptidase-dependent protein [Klebsiella pneumoniae]HBY0605445.1 prepilin peptidase-dependent protein [Klebsiella pneumoniae subsp. pneumoniae]EIX9194845.1 prepilin peptidase-dependent protein [Klebsiella pneumoniae]ELA2210515.1 prepilin peptidase-dependent protein [Klebsiella pneumoniae]EMB5613774.1 prepilin peptidase-dependent protein [Klebsiella pneumoniae]MBD7727276.1 prepilin peptidase-dependent protein [Klebsiella pneumoniae]